MTTVTGILRDAQQNAIPNAGVTVRYTRALVGFDGGAVAQNDRLFTTDGSGELVMADLIPGHYDVFVSMPANSSTSQAVIRRGTGTVPTGEATLTWEAFLSEPIGQFDSTVLQQAIEAAQDAQNAAVTAVEAAAGVEFPVSYAPQNLTAPQQAQARTNLGLGTIATQGADAVEITGGTIDGATITGGTIDGAQITGLADGVAPDDAATVGQLPTVVPPTELSQGQATDPDDETFGTVSGQRLAQHTDDAFNVTGDAPKYACRAWVNFDGTTAPPTIRSSGNVSSVTRASAGVYTVNFSENMIDANYGVSLGGARNDNPSFSAGNAGASKVIGRLSSGFDVNCGTSTNASGADHEFIDIAVFR